MSTYVRSPRKITVHCQVDGCRWLRTYFDDSRKQSLRARSLKGLRCHIFFKHRRRVTLINGR